MSELFSDEFLSAYLDGELSPHERAAVERWLERAPEARQRLEEFRGLSRLFGDLPRTEVPSEFPTEVLHLAERRMLLPEAGAGRGRKRIRGWVLGVSISTAAAVLLTITILNVDRPGDAKRGIAGNQPAGNVPGPAGDFGVAAQPPAGGQADDMLIAQDERSSKFSRQPSGGFGGAIPPAAASGSTLGGGSGGGAPAADVAPAKPSPGSLPAGSAESEPLLVAISDEVQRLRESGTTEKYLLVVRVRAVDRAEGLVLLQEMFAANNIRAEAGAAAEEKAVKEAGPTNEANSEGLYIEADADALIAGFKTTLARRHPGVRFVVEPAIELASLDEESRRQLLLVDVDQPASGPTRGDRTQSDPAPRSSAGKDGSEAAKPAEPRGLGAADRADKSPKADDAVAKANKKQPAPAVTSRSMPNSRTNQPSGPGGTKIERSASVPPPAKSDVDADSKDSPAKPEEAQVTNNSRQVVVPVVPPAIQNRPQASRDAKSTANKDSARSQKQAASKDDSKSGSGNARDAKPASQNQDKANEPAPALVRMLIVIESEPPQPAVPADKKGPSGGAS